ncbi:putative transferase [Helianthus annuus]|nr:putative transferase [Helianthus annuus]
MWTLMEMNMEYADDKYDRIWYPIASTNTKDIQTSSPISLGSSTKESVPSKVMSTAVIPANPTADLFYSWTATDKTEEYFMYIHYAEIETLEGNDTREFNIYLNDAYWDGPISPIDHTTSTYFTSFYNASSYELTLRRTENSTLPTMMNAIELYNPIHLQQRQTNDKDATTMWSTKSTYGLKRNWQGDPCVPQDSMWDGVKCSNDTDNLRIISMYVFNSQP